jgi:hypothetical protein
VAWVRASGEKRMAWYRHDSDTINGQISVPSKVIVRRGIFNLILIAIADE